MLVPLQTQLEHLVQLLLTLHSRQSLLQRQLVHFLLQQLPLLGRLATPAQAQSHFHRLVGLALQIGIGLPNLTTEPLVKRPRDLLESR